MNKCTGIMGWVFGHRFRPVITSGQPTITELERMTVDTAVRIIDASKPEVYHGLYCRRCGSVEVERK